MFNKIIINQKSSNITDFGIENIFYENFSVEIKYLNDSREIVIFSPIQTCLENIQDLLKYISKILKPYFYVTTSVQILLNDIIIDNKKIELELLKLIKV